MLFPHWMAPLVLAGMIAGKCSQMKKNIIKSVYMSYKASRMSYYKGLNANSNEFKRGAKVLAYMLVQLK